MKKTLLVAVTLAAAIINTSTPANATVEAEPVLVLHSVRTPATVPASDPVTPTPDSSNPDDPRVVVAVLDSGVNPVTPALAAALMEGTSFSTDVRPETEVAWSDHDGHGTSVAGVVLSQNPNVRILPVRITTDDGFSTLDVVATGIYWAANNGADVINISLGGVADPAQAPGLQEAIDYAASLGVVTVASAGNTGDEGSAVVLPAAMANVLAVGSVDVRTGKVSSFSNRGSFVDVAAPGGSVSVLALSGGTELSNGTSLSAPWVAALAAYLRELHPEWSSQDIQDHIKATASDRGFPGPDPAYGFGLASVSKALTTELSRPVGAIAPPSAMPGSISQKVTLGGVFFRAPKGVSRLFARGDDGEVFEVDKYDVVSPLQGRSYTVWGYDRTGGPTTPVQVELSKNAKVATPPKVQITIKGRNTVIKIISKTPSYADVWVSFDRDKTAIFGAFLPHRTTTLPTSSFKHRSNIEVCYTAQDVADMVCTTVKPRVVKVKSNTGNTTKKVTAPVNP